MDNPSMLFHKCALQAYLIAISEGKQNDSEYVKKLCYEFYEEDVKIVT
jgi:hypothetical protein